MEVGGWGGRNCAQCSMRSDDQKAHIQESMCANVTCARSEGEEVGEVWKIAAMLYVCVYRAHLCTFDEEYFDECQKQHGSISAHFFFGVPRVN